MVSFLCLFFTPPKSLSGDDRDNGGGVRGTLVGVSLVLDLSWGRIYLTMTEGRLKRGMS